MRHVCCHFNGRPLFEDAYRLIFVRVRGFEVTGFDTVAVEASEDDKEREYRRSVMDDYRERKTVFEVPIKRARPVVEAQYDSVVHESRGVSPASVVALVLAAVAATI